MRLLFAQFLTLMIPLGGCVSFDSTSRATDLSDQPITQESVSTQKLPPTSQAAASTADLQVVRQIGFETSLKVPPAVSGAGETETGNAEPSTVWTLEELQTLAVRNSPALRVTESGRAILEGRRWQAGLGRNPQLSYNADEVGDNSSAGLHSISINKTYIRGGKLEKSMHVVDHQIERNSATQSVRMAALFNNVRSRFYDVLIAQRQIELTSGLLANAEESVKVNQRQLDAQQISRNPLLQSRILRDTSKLLLANARNDRQAAWRKLAIVVGDPNLAVRPVLGDLTAIASDMSWEAELDDLLAQSPELAETRAAIGVARAQLQRAHAQGIPDVTGGVGVGYATSSNHVFSSLQVSVPLPVVDWNQGNVHAAEARLVQAQHEVQQLELDLQNRLVEQYKRWANAKNRLEAYRDRIVPLAEESWSLTKKAFDGQQAGYLDLLTSQQTLIRADLQMLAALRDLIASQVAIEGKLVGTNNR